MNRLVTTSSLLVAAAQCNVGSAHYFDGSSNSNPGAVFPSSETSQYNVHQQLSLNTDDNTVDSLGQTESLAFFSSDDECESNDTIFSSSAASSTATTLADTTIFCNGGSDSPALFSTTVIQQESLNPNLHNHPSSYFSARLYGETDDDDDTDEEGDDDDGDDGANLMLSNASVQRRSPVTVAYASRAKARNEDTSTNASTANILPFGSWRNKKSFQSKSTNSMLSLRGGAAGGTELSKRLLVAALVTLLYEGVLGHLLEFLKIVMQTSPQGTTYVQVLKRITADKGIVGIWDGFIPWGVVQSVFKGGVFGLAHAMALSFLLPLTDEGKLPKQAALTLAGGIAGGFQGFVLSPTLLLKTRVMTNDVFRESMSLWKTTCLSFRLGLDVIQNEGAKALMKGSNIFAFKRVCDWASRYYFSDVFAKMLLAHAGTPSLTPAEKIAADLLGGTASTIVTLPLDVIVAKIQDAKKAGTQVSAWGMFRDELEQGGLKGLSQTYLQGFEARLLHVCFTTVVMKTGTGFMYDFLFSGSIKAAQ